MQLVSSRIWTRVAVSISYDDNITSRAPPGYDIKQSDCEAPALEIRGIRGTSSLSLLPSLFWPGVVASDRVLSKGQIELFDI